MLHSHSIPATVLSRTHQANGHITLEGWEMQKGLEGVTSHETSIKVPVVNNSQSMASLVDAFLPHLPCQSHGILVAGHGLYAWGTTLFDAERHLEILEFLLEVNSIGQDLVNHDDHPPSSRHRRNHVSGQLCKRCFVSLCQEITLKLLD